MKDLAFRSWMRALLFFTLLPGLVFAEPDLRRLTELQSQFASSNDHVARAVSELFCREALRQFRRGRDFNFVSIRGAPGLYAPEILINHLTSERPTLRRIQSIIGRDYREGESRVDRLSIHPHEFAESTRLARYLFDAHGESLVMAPSIEQTELPAFDGIILDPSREFVARYSGKSIRSDDPRRVFTRLDEALDKIEEFSRPSRWGLHFLRQGGAEISERGHVLSWALQFFRITETRDAPNVIYLDLLHPRYSHFARQTSFLSGVRRWIRRNRGRVSRVILMHEDEVVEVTADSRFR